MIVHKGSKYNLRSTGTAKETRFKYPIRFWYGDGSGTAEGRTGHVLQWQGTADRNRGWSKLIWDVSGTYPEVILAEETTSEDEEVGSSAEDEEEDAEPQTQSTPLIQKSPPPRKLDPAIAVAGNEESEESGTESESESESNTATPNVKPLATKPMEDMNAKKPRSETVERRLKKMFENNAGKGKKGEDRSFSKSHEHNAFELSKKIWGKEGISGKVKSSATKSNGKAKANNKAVVALKAEFHSSPDKKVDIGVPMEVDKVPKSSISNLFDKRFCVSGLEEELLKHSLDMVDSERKATLEARWRKLQIAELELFIERNELVKEHVNFEAPAIVTVVTVAITVAATSTTTTITVIAAATVANTVVTGIIFRRRFSLCRSPTVKDDTGGGDDVDGDE
ncbi:RmlC-like cupins superfamily protein [Hibiscus syriacus]|uniref:RmlC-like cupins superfamily protein n=1 Tax=Hibiscus syriacus TaxID=106335 RepID=A0A6A2Y3S8_HIBSY|nr:RmlC-like cupins superfamily protein [Hibiscus syriacus]